MAALIPRTIRARFLLGSVLTILTALVVIALTVPQIARDHETEVLGARLASDAAIAGDLGRDAFGTGNADALDALAHRLAADAQIRVTFIGTDGTVLGESDEDRHLMENHATRPEVIPALAGREGRAVRQSATLGRDLLYVAIPVRDGDPLAAVPRSGDRLERFVIADHLDQSASDGIRTGHPARRCVGEEDAAVGVRDEDGVGQLVDERGQTIAFGLGQLPLVSHR